MIKLRVFKWDKGRQWKLQYWDYHEHMWMDIEEVESWDHNDSSKWPDSKDGYMDYETAFKEDN
jgi:hypothetical protein